MIRQSGQKKESVFQNKDLQVLALSLFFAAAFLILGQVFFETNDDETLNLICAGAYGPSFHLIYQNIAVGAVLSALFRLCPWLNWYLVLMLTMNALSIFLLCRSLTQTLERGRALLLTAAVQALLGHQFYNALQYSKNAALYTAVGALLLFRRARRRGGAAEGIAGTFLFVLGFLVRTDSFLSALPAAGAAGLAMLLRWERPRITESSTKGSRIRLDKERVRGIVTAFLPALLLIVCFFAVNSAADRLDPDWRAYLAYNEARTELLDYGLPDYKSHQEEMEQLGITRTDLKLLASWTWADPETFSLETLQALVQIRGGERSSRLRLNRTTLHAAARALVGAVREHALAACAAFLFVAVCFFLEGKELGMLLLMVLGICLEYWYLSCVGRVVWRGECGIWLSPMILLAGEMMMREGSGGVMPLCGSDGTSLSLADRKGSCADAQTKGRDALWPRLVCAAVLTGILLFSLLHTFFLEKGGRFAVENQSFRTVLDQIDQRGETAQGGVYLLDTMTVSSRLIAPNVWAMDGSFGGLYRHAGMLGGWEGASPGGQYYLRSQGIENPIRALAEREDVFLVDQTGTASLLETYFEEIYGCGAHAVQVDEVEGIPVWRFTLDR